MLDSYRTKHNFIREHHIKEFRHLLRPRQPIPGSGHKWPMTAAQRASRRRETYALANIEKQRTYDFVDGFYYTQRPYTETYGEAINRSVAIRSLMALYDQACIITEPVDPKEEYRRAYRIARKYFNVFHSLADVLWVESRKDAVRRECHYIGVLPEVAEKALFSVLARKTNSRLWGMFNYKDYLSRINHFKKLGRTYPRRIAIP